MSWGQWVSWLKKRKPCAYRDTKDITSKVNSNEGEAALDSYQVSSALGGSWVFTGPCAGTDRRQQHLPSVHSLKDKLRLLPLQLRFPRRCFPLLPVVVLEEDLHLALSNRTVLWLFVLPPRQLVAESEPRLSRMSGTVVPGLNAGVCSSLRGTSWECSSCQFTEPPSVTKILPLVLCSALPLLPSPQCCSLAHFPLMHAF